MCIIKTTYSTTVIGHGNHASIEIPDKNLKELGANKRAPLKITVNGYTYQSTATGVNGKCMVVFPQGDRDESGVKSGDTILVHMELDSGYRQVSIPSELETALKTNKLNDTFANLTYSKRKEYSRKVTEAKAEATRLRRIEKILSELGD